LSIRILPREVVEKIAAGEVVERPVSVVKELVENALDAGARSISVEIEGGGCDLIRVSDDGCGIQVNDLPLALQRHATSKISSATDLDSITTLGFRGEALFSIAAVSHFTLTSRPEGSEAAHQLHVQDGSQVGLTRAARAPGTTVLVEQLFYNVPARRKFLRSPAGEASQIATLIGQLALAYPEVAFRLVNGGRTALATSGRGEPTDTVLAVLGRDVAAALLPFETMIESRSFRRSLHHHDSRFRRSAQGQPPEPLRYPPLRQSESREEPHARLRSGGSLSDSASIRTASNRHPGSAGPTH